MKISKKGVDLIKSFEGFRSYAYKPIPQEKYWTIGYGHYGKDVKEGDTITKTEAVELLKKDLESYEKAVNECGIRFNQNEFDAMVSFAYNCGTGSIANIIKEGKFNITKRMALWVHGEGGVLLQGLVNRRNKEIALFNTFPSTAKYKPVIGRTYITKEVCGLYSAPYVDSVYKKKILKEGTEIKCTGRYCGAAGAVYIKTGSGWVLAYTSKGKIRVRRK